MYQLVVDGESGGYAVCYPYFHLIPLRVHSASENQLSGQFVIVVVLLHVARDPH